jgi:hypothetical protein
MSKIKCFKVQIDDDSNYYIITLDELSALECELDTTEMDEKVILTRIPDMTLKEIEALPEFEGF